VTIANTTPSAVRSRRPYRLGIDAHTEFVAVLVSEMSAAVASLQAAAGTGRPDTEATEGTDGTDRLDTSAIDRSVEDVRRLVRLLEIIDVPGEVRYLEPVNFPDAIREAAKSLAFDLDVRGVAGPERFLCDPESFQLGAELVLSAFAGGGGTVKLGIPNDRIVQVEGPLDFTDERRMWQLRCGRRVLEGENCRIRLYRVPGGYRLEIRALEP
jgi:hypothetical protein